MCTRCFISQYGTASFFVPPQNICITTKNHFVRVENIFSTRTKNIFYAYKKIYYIFVVKKIIELYGCSFAQRCILKKQSRNRTKTRKNMFFLILFGFYHVFLTGRTAAKNNIQYQPYRSKYCLLNMDFAFALLIYTLSHSLSRSA